MANEDFLLVVGNGWEEIPNATQLIDNNIGEEGLQQMISGLEWNNISQWLENLGLIPENHQIQNARLLNTNDSQERLRFWIIR